MDTLTALLLVWGVYMGGVCTPGPSTILLATTSMSQGRTAALATSAGILTGSLTWGILSATGVSALMMLGPMAQGLRYAAAAYMAYLSFRAARAAWLGAKLQISNTDTGSLGAAYRRGLLIHLTNPKAIVVWIAIVSVGTYDGAPVWFPYLVVGSCMVIGAAILTTYSFVFAMGGARRAYQRLKRWIEASAAAIFGGASASLLS